MLEKCGLKRHNTYSNEMQTSFDSLAVLTLLGIVQAILLAGALVGLKRGYSPANRILAAFLVFVSIAFGGNILTHTKFILSVPHLAQISAPVAFLIVPLLFFYVKSLVFRRNIFSSLDTIHLIPFFLCIAYLLPFYIQNSEAKIVYLTSALENHPLDWRIRTGLAFLQQFIYLIFIGIIFYKSAQRQGSITGARKANLYLAQFLFVGFTIVWLTAVVRFVIDYSLETNLIAPFIGCIFICAVIFKALQKPEVLSAEDVLLSKKYQKSTLKSNEAEGYLEKIINLMETEKLYLDKNLTLEKLARKLSILPPHLSQLINERLNQNFPDFINSYRVEEFKERLSDPQSDRYTIVAIAEASGFNSKSTFNSAFKKHTNLTPSEFKKTLPTQN